MRSNAFSLTRFIYADAQLRGPRLLRQGGFETRPYMSLDPSTTLDPVCCVAYVGTWPGADSRGASRGGGFLGSAVASVPDRLS